MCVYMCDQTELKHRLNNLSHRTSEFGFFYFWGACVHMVSNPQYRTR